MTQAPTTEQMDALRTALVDAQRELQALMQQRREELDAARNAVEAKFGAQVGALEKRGFDARVALEKAEQALAAANVHPLAGRKVTYTHRVYGRYSFNGTEVTRTGVLTPWLPGADGRLPDVRDKYDRRWLKPGDLIIVFLKKDGTPGKEWEPYSEYHAARCTLVSAEIEGAL